MVYFTLAGIFLYLFYAVLTGTLKSLLNKSTRILFNNEKVVHKNVCQGCH